MRNGGKPNPLLRALATAALLAALLAAYSLSYSVGPNYRNVSIDTRVNVTNAAPEILAVKLPASITLTAGSTHAVECNVTVRDWNGFGDLNYTEAVFYHSTSSPTASDDNNTHYTDSNCSVTSQNGNFANYTCTFLVYYYAMNGTWTCNATVYDNAAYSDTAKNTTTVNALLALNVTATIIDYGNLAVGDTSTNKTANVTNIGNVPINVSVKGYGSAPGDGLAFVCDQGNISVENEKFSINASHDYAAKTALSSTFQALGLTISKQQAPGAPPENATYWQLYVPPNPFGICNGTIVFQAESST